MAGHVQNKKKVEKRFQKYKDRESRLYHGGQSISDTEQHWKNLLRNQLQMGSTIVAFQNVEISMRVDAQKKLMLRQTFMLKKQIIKLIINEQYQLILPKLEQLRKTSTADYGLATLFIDFYQIQKEIIASKLEFRHDTIKRIKIKMEKYYQKLERQKGSIIYGRILYIVALHLIKLDGVLLKNEDINIVAQALIAKKKQLCMISSGIQKCTLQSLLFLTFEFYKILYLLKRDQDLITQYYNQIQAYISIYKTKCGNFQEFEKEFKIAEKIEKIKPLNLNLKIYEDHDRRRVLSVENTKEELMKNHYRNRQSTNLSSQITAEMKNREKKSLLRLNSFQSSCDKNSQSESKLNDSQPKVLEQALNLASKQSEQQNICWTNKFCFDFIKPDQLNILRGKFQVFFTDNLEEFKVQISIMRREEMIGLFKIRGFGLEKKRNLSDCAKKLWRIIKQKFYTDKTEFVPNLFSFQYPPFQDIPKNINATYELPILVRIHEMLLHYLRKQSKLVKINGTVLLFPATKSQPDKKQSEMPNPEYKVFAKRYGFISFNKKLRKLHSNPNVRMVSMDREPENELQLTFFTKQQTQYSIIQIDMGKNVEKRIITHPKHHKNIKSERNSFFDRYKIERLRIASQNDWRRKRVVNIIDYLQNYREEDEYFLMGQCYIEKVKQVNKNIEEEFEVMKSPILETKHNEIKKYRKFNYSKYKFNITNLQGVAFKTIKIEQKFFTFQEENFPDCTHYFHNSKQFFICPENIDKVLVYRKFRLYKCVVFKDRDQSIYTKVSRIKKKSEDSKRQLKIRKQRVDLKWVKTYIIKTSGTNNYFYVNLFEQGTKTIITIYDFVGYKNYMGVSENTETKWIFDEQTMLVNGRIKMREFMSSRSKFCEAQEYAATSQEECREVG